MYWIITGEIKEWRERMKENTLPVKCQSILLVGLLVAAVFRVVALIQERI